MASPATQIPRWFEHPEPVRVRIAECHRNSFFDEAVVVIRIGGKIFEAWVPEEAVKEDAVAGSTVPGLKIAETDENLYVAMPVSTITSPNLVVPKSLQTEVFA